MSEFAKKYLELEAGDAARVDDAIRAISAGEISSIKVSQVHQRLFEQKN
jgi:hypothetical protein